MAVRWNIISLKLAWEYPGKLNNLGEENKIALYWLTESNGLELCICGSGAILWDKDEYLQKITRRPGGTGQSIPLGESFCFATFQSSPWKFRQAQSNGDVRTKQKQITCPYRNVL